MMSSSVIRRRPGDDARFTEGDRFHAPRSIAHQMRVIASGPDQLLGYLGGKDGLAAHRADVADPSAGPRLVIREHEQTARGKPSPHDLTEIGKIVGGFLTRGAGDCPCRVEETTGTGNEG